MKTYITVLDSDRNRYKNIWRAVQWNDCLDSIRQNYCYTAGNNKDFPKSPEDKEIGRKIVEETSAPKHIRKNATIIEITKP